MPDEVRAMLKPFIDGRFDVECKPVRPRDPVHPGLQDRTPLMVVKDLKRVINTGKSRPEDRKLLAEISGLSQGEGVNVNVAMDSSGWFGRRWRTP